MTPLRAALAALLVAGACARQTPTAPPPDEQAPPDVAAAPKPAPPPAPAKAPQVQTFSATAYSIEGVTAAGTRAREGVVAADPDVLPLGSRIRVHGAGEYDGEYVVQDTGAAVKGREIDIYLAGDAEAKRFGRRRVRVELLERGDGARRR